MQFKVISYVATSFLEDPKKFLTTILLILITILALIIFIVVIPSYVATNFPALLLRTEFTSQESIDLQNEYFELYKTKPLQAEDLNIEWIAYAQNYYYNKGYDFVYVNNTWNVDWKLLLSFDSVKRKQDFSNVTGAQISSLINTFTLRYVETSEVPYTELVFYDDGTFLPETRYYKIATIYCLTRPFGGKDGVFDLLDFDEREEEMALTILMNLENNFQLDSSGNIVGVQSPIDLSNLQVYPPGDANVIYYHQGDARWGGESYGYSNIVTSGCGPTSLAMVISTLKNNEVTPQEVADWSFENGYYADGQGSYWSLISDGADKFGLDATPIKRTEPNRVLEALSEGHPVIVAMGRGNFTSSGHFIVLTGLDENGNILVNDPASTSRSRAWDPTIIFQQSSMKGGYDGECFWVIRN